MNRSFSTSAIVISLKPVGENNSTVTLITENNGIVYATLYGGPKSKLRSLVSQWHSGTIYLYENPEHNQIKISDFDVKNYHISFGENLFKFYAASLAAEIALKTKCAGSNEHCWKLLSGFLDGLELATEEQGRVGLIRYLWRFLELLGVQPDSTSCGFCNQSFLNQKFAPDTETYYNIRDNFFICSSCAKNNFQSEYEKDDNLSQLDRLFPLKLQAINYLSAINLLKPAEVRKLSIDKQSYDQIKNIVFYLIENTVEHKLNSIETGMGIL